jgi:hypothetical protein
MGDNTVLNLGTGGDTIRTIDKTASVSAKVQSVVLDVGGGDGSGESIVTSGNQLPVFDLDLDTYNETTQNECLFQILIELRTMNRMIFEGLGIKGDVEQGRADEVAALTGASNAS